jgi:PKD repeat protein
MKRSQYPNPCIALSVLLLCCILVPFVSAVPTTGTPTATVPPVLQACSQAKVPTANFTCNFPAEASAQTPDGPPYTMKCIDNSITDPNQSIVSWKWDFGDGGSSTDRNPEHTYSDVSRYDVRLTVTTFCGSQYSSTSLNSINIYCSVPVPGFTANVTEGYAPLAVGLNDTSVRTREDTTIWTYWFDDYHFSNEKNPVFVYTAPGIYRVNQTVSKNCIQLGSSSNPPAIRQIKVYPPNTGGPVNGTTITPTPRRTTAAPVATTPVITASTPAPATETTIIPATPAGVPGFGALSVDTKPSGAQVFIDDISRGTSPVTVKDLTAGPHNLRLEMKGYQSMTMQVTVPDRETSSLATTLLPESGGIALLPLVAMIFIICGILGGGIFLYLRQRAMNDD